MPIRSRSSTALNTASSNRKFSKVELKRAVDAVQKVGLDIGSVEIRPDGTISLRTLAAVSGQPETIFDTWADKA